MLIISPYLPFPSIIWWAAAAKAEKIIFDGNENFLKATSRNRYRIATANGLLQLSIPLQGGRQQRTPAKDIVVDNSVNWQDNHWRSIFSAYGRAPYFEYYAPDLERLFNNPYVHLSHFCKASISWLEKTAGISLHSSESLNFQKTYDKATIDWRFTHCKNLGSDVSVPHYPQVFEDRNKFLPNLSLLDVIMNEGPATALYIKTVAPGLTIQ